MLRLFIDSSVLFAAAYSAKGHSRDLILMAVRGEVRLVISSLVMEETRSNLNSFIPAKIEQIDAILGVIPFEFIRPTREEILEATAVVALRDAPILAGAKSAGVDLLVTLDKRHLLSHPVLEQFAGIEIVTPLTAFKRVQASQKDK